MNISLCKSLSTYLASTVTLFFGTTFFQSAQAFTLSGFATTGADMAGMQITVQLRNQTTETAIWKATGDTSGEATGAGWSLTQGGGSTYGGLVDPNPWTFSYTGNSSVSALIINAVYGNTVFDIVKGTTSSKHTSGSAEGWPFETVSGTAPDTVGTGYSAPLKGADKDLFGTLALIWRNGFSGTMSFLADTDSGSASDPVTPANVLPGHGFSVPRIKEGSDAISTLSAVDSDADAINFYVNGKYVGTDSKTSGTRKLKHNLGYFADNGTHTYTAQVQDSQGGWSGTIEKTLIVDNVAPTLTKFNLSDTTINEGESVSALFNSTDPGADSINFFLNGRKIGEDSSTSGTRTFEHSLGTFVDEGKYTYKGRAQDKDAAYSNEIVRNLTVLNVAPTIVSLTSDLEVDQEETFMFDALATDPGINDILTYMWDLDGDGNYNDFVGTSGNWSFADAGIQTIGLKVTDGDGGEAFSSFNVTVNPEPEPEPSPTPEPEPEPSPKQVPEPSSIIGLLTLSIGGFLLKRKKDN